MRATGSTLRRYGPEALLVLVIMASLYAMLVGTWGETIPFHVIWASFALVYGFRLWPIATTLVAFGVVVLASGAALAYAVIGEEGPGADELAEIPLMGIIFLVMMWHVRYRQRAAEELAQTAETRRRLLATQRTLFRSVSHALRTPVTVARGHAELLQAGAGTSDDVQIILDEVDRVNRLSDRLLAIAAAEEPQTMAREPVEVSATIAETERRWRGAAPRAWSFTSGRGWLVADRERLEMALDALIENAVKYTDPGDEIAVTARVVRDDVVFTVRDGGIGIAPADLPLVFDRFFRGERVRDRPGTGLGLSVVRAIAAAHGGSVDVTSDPGRGTAFHVTFPRVSLDEEASAQAPAPPVLSG